MVYAFQDYENLYLVMDLLTGGDLRFHISRNRRFTEEQTKFFFGCLLLGLEYIHKNNIIHRDIKPENLVCDSKGYIRITDFGVAKVCKPDNSSETSGTPGYMAPEVLMGQNHSFPVDFFAMGVMGYEFMFGQRPYLGRSRKDIKQVVLRKQVQIKDNELPDDWSNEAQDFINKLLQRKDTKRLGFRNGVKELKAHPFFEGFDWESLQNKTMISPFIPKNLGGNYDKKYCEAIDKLSNSTIERYKSYMKKENFTSLFNGYTYNNISFLENEETTRRGSQKQLKYNKSLSKLSTANTSTNQNGLGLNKENICPSRNGRSIDNTEDGKRSTFKKIYKRKVTQNETTIKESEKNTNREKEKSKSKSRDKDREQSIKKIRKRKIRERRNSKYSINESKSLDMLGYDTNSRFIQKDQSAISSINVYVDKRANESNSFKINYIDNFSSNPSNSLYGDKQFKTIKRLENSSSSCQLLPLPEIKSRKNSSVDKCFLDKTKNALPLIYPKYGNRKISLYKFPAQRKYQLIPKNKIFYNPETNSINKNFALYRSESTGLMNTKKFFQE